MINDLSSKIMLLAFALKIENVLYHLEVLNFMWKVTLSKLKHPKRLADQIVLALMEYNLSLSNSVATVILRCTRRLELRILWPILDW